MPQQKLLFIGDSISRVSGGNVANGQRFPVALYNSLTGQRPIYDNAAIPGVEVTTVISSFQSIVLDRTRVNDLVFCMIAINDLRGGASVATAQANILTLANLCLTNSRFFVHCTNIPGRLSGDPANVPQNALTLAGNMIALPSYYTAQVNPSLDPMFNSVTSHQNTTNFFDGLHPTDVGFDRLASIALPVVQPLINNSIGQW